MKPNKKRVWVMPDGWAFIIKSIKRLILMMCILAGHIFIGVVISGLSVFVIFLGCGAYMILSFGSFYLFDIWIENAQLIHSAIAWIGIIISMCVRLDLQY